MDAGAFVEIGRVASTHGLVGEVSVIMTVDLPVPRLCGLEVWFVPPPADVRTARISSVRSGPKGPLFTFDSVTGIDAAAQLRGRTVLARTADLPEIEEEFDPVGARVSDANDVWVVEGPFGEILIPVIDDVVDEIDEDAETIRVRLLPGLLDEG
jgi:16S rRNA processing protein RimM